MKTRTTAGYAIGAVFLATGCAMEPATDDLEAGSDALYGVVDPVGDCPTAVANLIQRSAELGRIASASTAFRECLVQGVRGPITGGYYDAGDYMACDGDEWAHEAWNVQLDRALAAAQSPNEVIAHCDGEDDDHPAWAGIGSYALDGPEVFTFDYGYLVEQTRASRLPYCDDTPEDDTYPDCYRMPGYGWPGPAADVARTIWHEAMHQQGYQHGDSTDDDDGAGDCGYDAADGYMTYRNDMPTIVGACIGNVLFQSGNTCPDPGACGGHGAWIVSRWNGTSCECVEDPQDAALALVSFKNGVLDDVGMLAPGQTLAPAGIGSGEWRLVDGDSIAATADFDGATGPEILLTGSQGLAVLRMRDLDDRILRRVPAGGAMGTWTLTSGDAVVGVGNFDRARGQEIILQGTQGIGVITMDGAWNLSAMYEISLGTVIRPITIPATTSWTVRSTDRVLAVADFTGDGAADLLLRNGNELGIVARSFLGTLQLSALLRPGDSAGAWTWSIGDSFIAAGQLDGTGGKDLLVRGDEGLGVLRFGSTGLTQAGATRFGTSLGLSWRLDSRDEVLAVADFDRDSIDGVLLRSFAKLGILELGSSGWTHTLSIPWGSTLPGGYVLKSEDRFLGAANFAGADDGADILLRDRGGFVILSANGSFSTAVRHPFRGNSFDPFPIGWSSRSVSMLGSWPLQSTDRTPSSSAQPFDPARAGIADFDGDFRADFVILAEGLE